MSLHRRIMAALVVTSLLAVALSGMMVFLLQERSIYTQTQEHLARKRDEITVLAREGIDRQTGQPFQSPRDLLYQHLQSQVLGYTEGAVGFVDGHPRFIPPASDIHPERDQELLALIDPYLHLTTSRIDTAATSTATYMYVLVPIEQGPKRGALLHVVDMDHATSDLRQSMMFYALAAAFVLSVVVVAAWPLVRRLLHPIEELRSAAESIDEHDLTQRVPVRSQDDLGVLASAFNKMLDRLQVSVNAQRDLLDDVGHELRTPITIVRGHLEVLDTHDPHDVEEVKDLSVDELDRMASMVNDILMLAKATDTDFITPVMTDIADLTESVYLKAQALGKREWVCDQVAHINLMVDSSRLTQAWLQLASNAVKYSHEDSPVHIGSAINGHEVRLWVTDRGVGITEEDLPKVTQRFVRGDSAHQHGHGSGLGLSIVDTIVSAHGATMSIESTYGHGTTVTMKLPLDTLAQTPQEKTP